jgi:uncharacterized protein YxjI
MDGLALHNTPMRGPRASGRATARFGSSLDIAWGSEKRRDAGVDPAEATGRADVFRNILEGDLGRPFMAAPGAPNPYAQSIISSLSSQPLLLMQMKVLSLGKNYSVMDPQKRLLATIGLDANQNMTGAVIGSAVASVAGDYIGRYARRSLTYTYDVKDPTGNLALQIVKSGGGNSSSFAVNDPSTNGSFGTIQMKRSLFGGLKATWVDPNGQTRIASKGNIIRRKYAMLGPDGREIGRVRHKILAIRDTWELELEAGSNHLFSALFATVLDFEKKM